MSHALWATAKERWQARLAHPPEQPHESEERRESNSGKANLGTYSTAQETQSNSAAKGHQGKGDRHHRHDWRYLIQDDRLMHAESRRYVSLLVLVWREFCFWLGKISKALWGNILSFFFGFYLGPFMVQK
jgi:hypothetical protein